MAHQLLIARISDFVELTNLKGQMATVINPITSTN
ncbi:MAG: hypothetical protein HNEKOMLI_00524 [Sodalis sp. Psp]|nr:hypothetical protein [Sodalis sp. Psp]MCR3756996.1 hypothetical protein [Sodalis sp. Ppy]